MPSSQSQSCPPVPAWRQTALIAWLVGVGVAWALYRKGRILGFDPYYYCEYAKLYALRWPRAFGDDWPCGYPLLGGLLGRLGLPAYPALCLISLLALAVLAGVAARMLAGLPGTRLVAVALSVVPVVGVQLFGAFSELPFAAALLLVAAALATGAKPSAFWLAGAFAVLAFTFRYAGVIPIGVLWIWLIVQRRTLRADGALAAAAAACGVATLTALALLGWNYAVTGYLTSPDHGSLGDGGVHFLPRNVADMGWSLPSALMLGGLRSDGWLGRIVGWGLYLPVVLGLLWAWLRPRHSWVGPVALVALAYLGGMVLLRTISNFDRLFGPRMFLPAIFPLGLAAVGQLIPRWRRGVAAGCMLILLLAGVAAVRGMSRELGGDVRPAAALLKGRLRPGDRVQINTLAFSLSAYFAQPVEQAWPEYWEQNPVRRFLVIAARRVGRSGSPEPIDPAWQQLTARLVASGSHRYLLRSAGLLVLERIEPAALPR